MPEKPFKHDPVVAKMVDRQMRNLELLRSQRPPAPAQGPAVQDFITVSRAVGSGGSEVARLLGERLGWSVLDKQILQHMAGDDSVRERLYASMDERDLSWVEEAMRAFLQAEFVKNDYFHRLAETVLATARQGHAIFVGRGADLVLPRDLGLRVRLVASHADCVRRYAEQNHLAPDVAEREIAKIEKEREQFIRTRFRVDPARPDRYDVVLNLSRLTVAGAVDVVLAAMKARAPTS